MPSIEASIDFQVYCGICGRGCCRDTDVSGNTITVTCSDCKNEIEDLKAQIAELEVELAQRD